MRITKTHARELNIFRDKDDAIIQERNAGIAASGRGRRSWSETRIWLTVDELRRILAKIEAGDQKPRAKRGPKGRKAAA